MSYYPKTRFNFSASDIPTILVLLGGLMVLLAFLIPKNGYINTPAMGVVGLLFIGLGIIVYFMMHPPRW